MQAELIKPGEKSRYNGVMHAYKTVFKEEGIAGKVEKILKGNLNLVPSPSSSVKIQIMGGKVCLTCKGKTLLGVFNKLLKTKKNVDKDLQCFASTPQANFPAHNLNLH